VLSAFLAAADLDRLAELADDAAAVDSAGAGDRVRAVLDDWADEQAIANLLMYPQLIPTGRRAESLLRGLRDPHSYLRLAAAVGLGRVDGAQLTDSDRADALAGLLALVEHDADVTASRAALSVATVLRQPGAAHLPDVLDVLVRQPSRSVRRNLEVALLGALDTPGLRALVDDSPAPDAARAVLAGDGIDLELPAADHRLLSSLAHVPNLAQWHD
jgi:hypothetical protein